MLERLQQSPSSLIRVNIIIMLNISHEMMIGRQLGSAKQLLIVPITFWSGLEQGFFGADFTAVPIPILILFIQSLSPTPAFHSRASSLVHLGFIQLVGCSSCMARPMPLPPLLQDFFAGKTPFIRAAMTCVSESNLVFFSRKVGRLPIFLLAAVINLAVIVAMLVSILPSQYKSKSERKVLLGADFLLLFPV